MPQTRLHQLADAGQSVWSDYLSRSFVKEGGLQDLVDKGVVGVTSNPTIFQGAIAEGDAYDDQIRELVSEGTTDARDIFWQLAKDDIRDACDVMAPVFESTGHKDGWVSLEVDPDLANDAQQTGEQAQRLHALVERPNLFIKIPATLGGLEAIEETIARGIPVNVTLIFSLERHRQVADAYIKGLRRFADDGGDLSTVASVASFFVSRVDTEADKRLEKLGGHDELLGKLAIANAKLAYQTYKEVFTGPEWEDLAARGATPQRCLWASTSTKNPAYRDVVYVEELVGPDTVNTMPRETIEATIDHAEIRPNALDEDLDGAKATLEAFAKAGIDYDDVVETLEREGVEKFSKSFADLVEGIERKRDALVAA
jgi:transaldolase